MNILMENPINNQINPLAAVNSTTASVDYSTTGSPVSPLFCKKEVMTPNFDRSDTGPLHAPIKKKKTKKIPEQVLDPVKKNMGHIFNFILEDMKKRENIKNERAYVSYAFSDVSSDSEEDDDVYDSDEDSNYDYENPEGNEYFNGNFDSDGEFDESDDRYDYGDYYKL